MTRQQIAEFIETISNVKDQRVLVNRSIQIAMERMFEYHDFPFYMQEAAIETVATYSTGTVTVTNGSKTVTGALTVFTSAMVGRKFRVTNQTPYYRIATFVSGTEITLEQNFQGTGASAQNYEIYKDEYRLAADVDKYKLMRQLQNGIALLSLHPTRFDSIHPAPQSYADPVYEIMSGTKLDYYTTGTVSAATNTITGVGTAWTSVEGLGRMSHIRIGSNVYTVKSVGSDTSITTYETVTSVSAGTAYEITLNNLVVQFYQIPNSQRLLYYRYFRLPFVLANDYDQPDMPHSFHWILLYGGLALILLQKGDVTNAQQAAEQRFVEGLSEMKLKLGSFTPDRIYSRKSVDRLLRIRTDGLETPNYDRKYSS